MSKQLHEPTTKNIHNAFLCHFWFHLGLQFPLIWKCLEGLEAKSWTCRPKRQPWSFDALLAIFEEGLLLIFVETERWYDCIEDALCGESLPVLSIRRDKSRRERKHALSFRVRHTDVTDRGFDVTNSVNFDLPTNDNDRTDRTRNFASLLSYVNVKHWSFQWVEILRGRKWNRGSFLVDLDVFLLWWCWKRWWALWRRKEWTVSWREILRKKAETTNRRSWRRVLRGCGAGGNFGDSAWQSSNSIKRAFCIRESWGGSGEMDSSLFQPYDQWLLQLSCRRELSIFRLGSLVFSRASLGLEEVSSMERCSVPVVEEVVKYK